MFTNHRRLREHALVLADYLTATCADTAVVLDRLQESTEDLLIQATERRMLAAEIAEDIRQNALGNVRVCCRNCDGEYFVPRTEVGPFFCTACHNSGWPHAYPAVNP
ncbi:hypothetical protein AB0M20_07950 [Actinoplanes sp. NPDC051633]|uniref:hypothetical protein n=1 Tax=Actinoplanes sp. NPDC051633 TaxID=3155670 RepID=UPI00343285B7